MSVFIKIKSNVPSIEAATLGTRAVIHMSVLCSNFSGINGFQSIGPDNPSVRQTSLFAVILAVVFDADVR